MRLCKQPHEIPELFEFLSVYIIYINTTRKEEKRLYLSLQERKKKIVTSTVVTHTKGRRD